MSTGAKGDLCGIVFVIDNRYLRSADESNRFLKIYVVKEEKERAQESVFTMLQKKGVKYRY
jgi:uncharacterized protein YlaI